MAEAELHVLRMRLTEPFAIKPNGENSGRGLPVGLLWGEGEGQVIFHPDQAVPGAIGTVFEKFAEWARPARCGFGFNPKVCCFRTSVPVGRFFGLSPTYHRHPHRVEQPGLCRGVCVW